MSRYYRSLLFALVGLSVIGGFLLGFIAPSSIAAEGPSRSDLDVSTDDASLVELSVREGRVTLAADNVPLVSVLSALSDRTGAEFVIHPEGVYRATVSATLRDAEFREAIARLLSDYNYLLAETTEPGKAAVVTVLSEVSGGAPPSGTPRRIAPGQGTKEAARGSAGGPRPESRATVPPSEKAVDECESLDFTPEDAEKAFSSLGEMQAAGYQGLGAIEETEAVHKRVNESKIARARRALSSDRCSHVWKQRIEDLAGIQDDRALEILANLAETSKDPEIRLAAAEALWRNAADTAFANPKGIEALTRLTRLQDPRVRAKAESALEEYRRLSNPPETEPFPP